MNFDSHLCANLRVRERAEESPTGAIRGGDRRDGSIR